MCLPHILSPVETRRLEIELREEWAEEAENLTETRAIVPGWLLALKMKADEEIVSEIESHIVYWAKKEWGLDTVIDFDRTSRMVAVEHPEHGVVGLGSYVVKPPTLVKDDGEFVYDWNQS